jgi:DNA-dependent RNA polymerase auxiliary subunit epsilon
LFLFKNYCTIATPFLIDDLFYIIGFITLLSDAAVDYTFLNIGGLEVY